MRLRAILTISLIKSTALFALFGAGDIVSDPASYGYYAKQLNEAKKLYESAEKQVKGINETIDSVNKTKNSIYDASTSILNAQDLISNTIKKGLGNKDSSLKKLLKLPKPNRGAKTLWDLAEDIDTLHDVYVDVSEIESEDYDPELARQRVYYRKVSRDAVLLDILEDSEPRVKREEERKDRVDLLTKNIKSATSVVDALALQALLTKEIIELLKEIDRTLYALAQAEALTKYKGTKFEDDAVKRKSRVQREGFLEGEAEESRKQGYNKNKWVTGKLPKE